MNTPDGLRYTDKDEWIRRDGPRAVVGITDYAQSHLGDITFVELSRVGNHVRQAQPIATVESVKAASEVYAPVSGTVVAVNEKIAADPGLINREPYGDGWFVVLEPTNPAEFDTLMDAAAYAAYRAE